MRNRLPEHKNVIMVFGTFDPLHKGHLDFFRQAKGLAKNPFLLVSVARDVNIIRLKGRKPAHGESKRLEAVAACGIVDKAVLGNKRKYIEHIAEFRPKILALGYDQVHYTQNLKDKLVKAGIKARIVRLKPYKPAKYKSSIIKGQRANRNPKNVL